MNKTMMSGVLSSSYKQVAAVKSGCIGVYRQYNTCNTEVSLGSIINTCTRAAALILCNLSSIIGCIHGAIVAATGRSDRRGDCRGDDRPVYTLCKGSTAIEAVGVSGDIIIIDPVSSCSCVDNHHNLTSAA